jgi:hypothetical protein
MILGLSTALVSALGTTLSALLKRRAALGSLGQSGYAIRYAEPRVCFGRGGSRSDGAEG